MALTQGLIRRLMASAALVLFAGLTGAARADFYAYAVQQTNNYTFTGATRGPVLANSSSSAVLDSSISGSEAHVGVLDALQSYVGPAAGRPPENTFTPKGLTTPPYA